MKDNAGLPIGLGLCFFVVFWQALDNLALGIGLGVALGAAIATTAKKSTEDESAVSNKEE